MAHGRHIEAGEVLPVREFTVNNVQLFLYNAALWNAHRIHYDHPYALEVEHYPALVNAGPLMGDWLTQCAVEWMGEEGRLVSIAYRNREAAYVGDVLSSGGVVQSVDRQAGTVTVELFLTNQHGTVVVPGEAVIHFPHLGRTPG